MDWPAHVQRDAAVAVLVGICRGMLHLYGGYVWYGEVAGEDHR